MKVPLLDLKAQYAPIKAEIDVAVASVFESQYFINGPEVAECEKAVAAYSNCPFACGVSSGTDALVIALMVEGIGAGDEVITTPYTFFATVGSIARVGATPVFVDIDPVTFNIDPTKIEEKISDKTKAIIPVHLYGQLAPMDPIMDIAKRHNLVVIEDGAQAIGAEDKGRRAGSFGDYGCFSFFPSKNLGGAGDGGMVVASDENRAELLARYRNHGSKPKYYHQYVGGNFRLDTLQAAVVTVKLKYLDEWTAKRQSNAKRYEKLFKDAGLDQVGLPVYSDDPAVSRHIFNQFVIRVEERDALRAHLQENGVSTEVYYPVPLHLQDCFVDLGHKDGDFPHSENAATHTIALPIYPEVTDEQAAYVVDQISAFFKK